MALPENVCINITTSTCHRYNCHNIYDRLLNCIRENNGANRPIYQLLVRHFGRVLSYSKTSFVGELDQELNYKLLNDINKDLFLQVKKRKKYPGCTNIFVVFFAM